MNWIEAGLLGLVQGLTEFLPVSSSGHLVIGQELLDINAGDTTFAILVHAATVLATITVFWGEIGKILRNGFRFRRPTYETHYVLKIALSMIPVAIIGFFFKDEVEALFGGGIKFVGAMLLVTAALLMLSWWAMRMREKRRIKTHDIGYADAFVIGVAQAIAVIPGISRSGATISTGLLLGNDRTKLAKFSFLMVLVPILGEAALGILKGEFAPAVSGIPLSAMVVGFLAAYISGLFACRVMINIVSRGKLYWFALYCAIVGIVAIIC